MNAHTLHKFNRFLQVVNCFASIAIVVLSVYITANYARDIYAINTAFIILIIGEICLVLTNMVWLVSNIHYKFTHNNVGYYSSTYSRYIILTVFNVFFVVISMGACVTIINLSLRQGLRGTSYFNSSYKLWLGFIPLLVVSMLLKGSLFTMNFTTIVISSIQLSSVYNSSTQDLQFAPTIDFTSEKNPSVHVAQILDSQNINDTSRTSNTLNSDNSNIRKTVIYSPGEPLSFHSANMTPPLSAVSLNKFTDSVELGESLEPIKSNERNLTRLKRKVQLSPIHEPAKNILAESPVFRKGNNNDMLSGDKKIKLNRLLLDNFNQDFNSVLEQLDGPTSDPAKRERRQSTVLNPRDSFINTKKALRNKKNLSISTTPKSPIPDAPASTSPQPELKSFTLNKLVNNLLDAYSVNTLELEKTPVQEEGHEHDVTPPESWGSNYDPLYEHDLQDIPSIPTNTLWPFTKKSPTNQKISPPNDRSMSSSRNSQRKGLRHISLEEWSANSKNWMESKYSAEDLKTEEKLDEFLEVPEPEERNKENKTKPTHQHEDSFTFEKENQLNSGFKFPQPSGEDPLATYSQTDINILNSIRGEKRRTLLKSNQRHSIHMFNSEQTSPKKSRSRSPLKRLSKHETKRSTVLFDDDFNDELADLQIAEEKSKKNFSISSIKSAINHLHTRSLSLFDGSLNPSPHSHSYSLVEQTEKFDWKFENLNEIAKNVDNSLIKDVIEHEENYDFTNKPENSSATTLLKNLPTTLH